MRRGPNMCAIAVGAIAARAAVTGPLKLRRRAALHAGGDFLAEQFQEQFGHVQSFRAGSMSVWAKSLPLNSRGSRVSLARA